MNAVISTYSIYAFVYIFVFSTALICDKGRTMTADLTYRVTVFIDYIGRHAVHASHFYFDNL